jgi:arylsulfatase A-like enzyme
MNSSPQQVVLLYLCFAATTASISTGKPNILFLQCDEMDGRVLDPNHPLSAVTSMPHLQKLAARGVNFVRAYAENPLCAPSRAGLFTGRRTSSIRVWNNVKALTALIDDPTQPDPTCANVVGYGADWCVEEGKKQNVTSSIRHELVQLGYDVHLVGKMDTGGGVCREGVDHCFGGNGYHDTGNWSTNTSNVRTYYKGDLIHSWASSASIGEPVFQPLESPRNAWISTDNPDGGPFPQDWPMINRCVDFLRNLGGPTTSRSGEEAGAKPFALYCSVLDPHPYVLVLRHNLVL